MTIMPNRCCATSSQYDKVHDSQDYDARQVGHQKLFILYIYAVAVYIIVEVMVTLHVLPTVQFTRGYTNSLSHLQWGNIGHVDMLASPIKYHHGEV